MEMGKLPILLILIMSCVTATLSGCAALLAGTAGGVIATEATENDNRIDPLEKTDVGKKVYKNIY